ncbi:endonuclease domain-containing protein [Bacillus sp. AK031]
MKPYDAKDSQMCKICGFEISHNKQGRFTSHIKNEHGLTLKDYLISYYYTEDDLECFNDTCNGIVQLRRGKPNKYCSTGCGRRLSRLRECEVCSKEFEKEDLRVKTCSEDCHKLFKSRLAKTWHESMDEEKRLQHFHNIISKTAITRKENGTPSWNSGKTGIYSEETIEKIRQATLRQMEDQVFQKTKIEYIIEKYLKKLNVNYKYSFILQKRQFDFLLVEYQIIIECDGDYWHANPKFYPEPKDWQKERSQIDLEKNEIAQRNGYQITRFWEDDILNNFDYVKHIINNLLATTQLETANVNA